MRKKLKKIPSRAIIDLDEKNGGDFVAEYKANIALEVHCHITTRSKMFCSCQADYYGAEPNTHTCPVCLGLPGSLPVINRKAIENCIKLALALNCEIADYARFHRKNYYYPDLPKNYQISQYDLPLSRGGYLDIQTNGNIRRIRIRRVHIEEDTGKSIHPENLDADYSLVDYNRCGIPLAEVVTEPDITTPEEAAAFMYKLRSILQYLGVSSGDMEKGAMRADVNISIRPADSEELGVKTEIKNLNSAKAAQKALEEEFERQTKLSRSGERVAQVTLDWDATTNRLTVLRSKEYAHDYRYFIEPDLVPLTLDSDWVEELRKSLPELPTARRERFISQYGIPPYDAEVITASKALGDFFEKCASQYRDAKAVSNWVMGDLLYHLKQNDMEIEDCRIAPAQLVAMLKLLDEGVINSKIAKIVFEEMFDSGRDPQVIVEEKGLVQISDEKALQEMVDKVVAENPESAEAFLDGKKRALNYLVGQIMKMTRGKAKPDLASKLIRDAIEKRSDG